MSGITSSQNSATFHNKQRIETTEDEKDSFNYRIKTNLDAKLQDFDDDFQDQEHLGGLSYCGSFRFFVKHSCRDLLRHKCQFCLAFCSVFVVVLSVIVVNTVITRGPLVFLKLSEQMNGEWDAYMYMFSQLENGSFSNADSNNWWCLNYTHI